ncbi:hypothetical protein GCM10028862_07090 [Luteimonas pelagia]
MNRPPLATALAAATIAATAALLPGSPLVRDAHAATGIQRCEAADGSVVYTDKPCGAFGATATPMSGELMTRVARIAREESLRAPQGTPGTGAHADAASFLPGQDAPVGNTTARRSASDGCARTPTQLAMDLRGSFALRDVNRIAESYHWAGMGSDQAKGVMARLEQLATDPLMDTQFFDATISLGGFADASGSSGGSSSGGIMQLMFGEGGVSRVVDMDVERYQGCYFVRF